MATYLPHTRLVRSIMRQFGKTMLYTNSYKSGTRTVKCYASHNRDDAAMLKMLRESLTATGKPFWIKTPKIVVGMPAYYQTRRWDAIIVGFPNDK